MKLLLEFFGAYRTKLVFANVLNFHPSLLVMGKAGSVTIKTEFRKVLHSGKLQPCL
jgi:hypothetical protein